MMDPVEHFAGRGQLVPLWLRRAVNHDDRHVQRACCGELGISACSTGVFGDDEVDLVGLHQSLVGGFVKRSPVNDDLCVRQGQGRFGRINKAQDVAVLRVRGERGQMHSAHGEQDVAGRAVEGRDGGGDVGHVGPVVARMRAPSGPGERDHGHICGVCGGHGVVAHHRSEGMRGVDQVADLGLAQVGGQAINAPEPTDTLGQGLAHGAVDAACETDGARKASLGHGAGQCGGLKRAAKDQEVGLHG